MPSPRSSSRWFRRAVAALALVPLAAVTLTGCGGDDDSEQADNTKATTQEVAVPGAKVTLDLASIDLQSAGAAAKLDEKTKVAVMTQTRRYVTEAVVRPLLSGAKVRKVYGALFGPTVRPAAIKAHRAALTDEGVGKVSGDVRAPKTKVGMHALLGADGSVQYIATNFSLKVRSELGDAPLAINRRTELTFEKNAKGKWLVSAYRVLTTRGAGKAKTAKATTTTAAQS
jgi:hypothetical protein